MRILYVGIDLAKNAFAVHGVDEAGRVLLRRPKVARNRLREALAVRHKRRPNGSEAVFGTSAR